MQGVARLQLDQDGAWRVHVGRRVGDSLVNGRLKGGSRGGGDASYARAGQGGPKLLDDHHEALRDALGRAVNVLAGALQVLQHRQEAEHHGRMAKLTSLFLGSPQPLAHA